MAYAVREHSNSVCSTLEDEMNYAINEADRKRLTEFRDGCCHEWEQDGHISHHKCIKCGMTFSVRKEFLPKLSPFTTPDDRQALCEALMRKGKWEEFEQEFSPTMWSGNVSKDGPFYYWLLIEQPERCNYLIAKFLEVEK
jgi:hypothetical protein